MISCIGDSFTSCWRGNGILLLNSELFNKKDEVENVPTLVHIYTSELRLSEIHGTHSKTQ